MYTYIPHHIFSFSFRSLKKKGKKERERKSLGFDYGCIVFTLVMYAYFEGFPVLFGQRLLRNSLAEEAMSLPLVPGTDLSDIPARQA